MALQPFVAGLAADVETPAKLAETQGERDSARSTKLDRRLPTCRTTIWLLALTNFALLANVVTALWLPSLIKGSGISDPLHIGWMTSIPYAVAITTMILVARNSDRTGERRWHAVVPALVASIGVIWMSFSLHEPVMLVFAAALCIGGALTLNALFWNLPTALLSGNAAVVGIAFINSVGQLAGFTAPAVFGWLFQKSGSPAYGLLSLGALFAVGGLAVLCIPKTAVNR